MAQLHWDPEADEAMGKLESTAGTDPLLLERLDSALDMLEANPCGATCRRHRLQNIGVWAISVVAAGEQRTILWEPGRTGDDVIVHAIYPLR